MQHTAVIYLNTVKRMVDTSPEFFYLSRNQRDRIVLELTSIVGDLEKVETDDYVQRLRNSF